VPGEPWVAPGGTGHLEAWGLGMLWRCRVILASSQGGHDAVFLSVSYFTPTVSSAAAARSTRRMRRLMKSLT